MRNQYPALAFVAGLAKVLGWLVMVIGILGAIVVIVACATERTPYGLLGIGAALASIPVSILSGLGIVARGEWIDLHLELAANSRLRESATFADEPLDWAA